MLDTKSVKSCLSLTDKAGWVDRQRVESLRVWKKKNPINLMEDPANDADDDH